MIKSTYGRYRLRHTSTIDLRRGSRAMTTIHQTKNGTTAESANAADAENGKLNLTIQSSMLLPVSHK